MRSLASNVFISEISPCVCQLQWKARDTTESGSRFNRFYAISTSSLRYLSSISREDTFPQWGFLEQMVQPSPSQSWEQGRIWSCRFFVPRRTSFPTCVCMNACSSQLATRRSRWSVAQFARPRGSQVPLHKHTLGASRHACKQHLVVIINMSMFILNVTILLRALNHLETLCFYVMWLAFIVPTKVILLYCKHVISNPDCF